MLVDVRLLGGFDISVDGSSVPSSAWARRDAAALVKVLALTEGARCHRERLMDLLWPDLAVSAATPRLHKAAHFARLALGHREAVVLRGDVVTLFPGATVVVDVLRFDAAASAALRHGESATATELLEVAIGAYRGELLPDDPYADWAAHERERLGARYVHLLRVAGRWEDVLLVAPADEQAHLELLRSAVVARDRATALRRYDAMERVLMGELGVAPAPEAVALRERALTLSSPGPQDRSPAIPRILPGGASRPTAEHLLERERHLHQLTSALDDAVACGRGAVVLVSGEAGCGKTALISAFLDGARADVDILVGGCDDLLASRSLGPFRDMATANLDVAAALDTDHSDDVFGRLLRVMARPTAMVIEDVHWADDATLDVIRYLARRIGGLPSLVILSVREESIDSGHPLRRLLGGLSGRSLRRLALEPLSADAVGELAARAVGDVDVAELHRVTRGNAFFVTEVLAGRGVAVPPTVRDAVLARTSGLPSPVRALIEGLSVVPTRAERWLARTLAGGDDRVVVQAEQSGVLSGTPTHVSFRHELARRAVETSLTVGERVRANAAVAEALLDRPPVDPSRLVHHAERADRTDWLVQFGPAAAADAIRFGAHRQAAETLRLVLQHVEAFAPADAARMLNQLAYSLYVLNEFDAALECAERAVHVATDANAMSVRVDALSTLSRVVYWARGPDYAHQASQQAVDLLTSADPRDDVRLAAALIDLARAESNLATLGIVAEPNPVAEAVAQQAVDLAVALDRDDLRSQALTYLGSSRLANHDQAGFADLTDAVALSASDPRIENQVRVRVNAAGSYHRAGHLDEALRHVAAGLRVAPDVEFIAGEYRLRLTEAAIHVNIGAWDQAIDELRDLVALGGGPGAMRHLAASLLSRVMARRGDAGSRAVLVAPLEDPMTRGDNFVTGPLAIAQLELRWLFADTSPLHPIVATALHLASSAGHRSMHAELCAYLHRAGFDAAPPAEPPGPWADVLAGRWSDAAAAWAALGDRYERAVVLAWHGDRPARAEGLAELHELGATATIDRIGSGSRRSNAPGATSDDVPARHSIGH